MAPRRAACAVGLALAAGLFAALASAAGTEALACLGEGAPEAEPAPAAGEGAAYARERAELVARLCARPANAALARRVAAAREALPERPEARSAELRRRVDAAGVALLRVPGLLWESRPETGADLRVVEALLGRPVPMVHTAERATVGRNAARVAERVRALARRGGRPLLLVSASKGSAEVRAALEGEPALGAHVAAWIDLVGVLEGTPLTDPDVPWQEVVTDVMPPATARSLSRAVRAAAAAPERFPEGVSAVHVAAFPSAEDVSRDARPGFEALRSLGPNDGFVLLRPLLRAPGRVLPLRGVDHYLRIGALRDGLGALLSVVLEELDRP